MTTTKPQAEVLMSTNPNPEPTSAETEPAAASQGSVRGDYQAATGGPWA